MALTRGLEEALTAVAGILDAHDYPEFIDQVSINDWVRAQRQGDEPSSTVPSIVEE